MSSTRTRQTSTTSAIGTLIVVVVGMSSLILTPARSFQSRASQTQPKPSASQRSSLLPIRVNLTPTPQTSLKIAIDGPVRIQLVGSQRQLAAHAQLATAEVAATSTGIRIGSQTYAASRLELIPRSSPSIWVNGSQYRGSLRLFRQPGQKVLAVNVLPIEEYIASVVDSEMPAAFPAAARRAQAVVARTYALYQMERTPPSREFDVYADTRSQKYLGYQYRNSAGRLLAGETTAGRKISQETTGVVCAERNHIFCTYYSAVCGGHTTPGAAVFSDAAPMLASVPCDWCREARLYRWDGESTKIQLGQELQSQFRRQQRDFAKLVSVRAQGETVSGGIPRFLFSDGRRQVVMPADELRRSVTSVKLHSPHFTITEQADRLIFQGRGHGHGAGLCQWGARGQAQAGRNFVQILRHYYPGTRVVRMAQ